jgi:hypothetical protein
VRLLPAILLFVCTFPAAAAAQWLHHPTPGNSAQRGRQASSDRSATPHADGKPDLSGIWLPATDRYYNNIRVGLDAKEVQPSAQALMEKRLREFGKDSMETLCLPMGPAVITTPYREARFIQTPTLVAILYEDLTHRQIFMDGRQAIALRDMEAFSVRVAGDVEPGSLRESVALDDQCVAVPNVRSSTPSSSDSAPSRGCCHSPTRRFH